MKRVFLSFSVSDEGDGRHFVRHLFERLAQQDAEPWIFESPQGEIRTGASISLACRRAIEQSDVFLVFITDRALRSDYVGMEVAHALWERRRRDLPIVPLVATRTLKHEWPVALAEAAGFRGLVVPPDRRHDLLEPIVVRVCEVLQIDYVPPRPRVPRLPLRQRLSDELQARKALSAYDVGAFVGLLRKCDAVADAMSAGDSGRARRLVESLLTDLELEYGLADTYYPRIVHGAILLAEAHAGGYAFAGVERHFAALIAERGERLDANAFAGLGHALAALGRVEEALIAYDQADARLDCPDAALFYSIVRARARGGIPLDRADIARRHAALAAGVVTRAPGELARLTSAVSLAYAYLGDVDAALQAWVAIGESAAVFPELVFDIAWHLRRHAIERAAPAALEAAARVLDDYFASRPDLTGVALLPLRHLHARIAFDRGDVRSARRAMARLVESGRPAPVLQVDAAMFALAEGDVASGRRFCEAAVSLDDHTACEPPIAPPEFHLAQGHAFWLLGRHAEATESFRRSRHDASLWYGTTMPREFGVLR